MHKLIDATAEHRDQIDESFLSPSARIRLAGTGQGAGQEPSGTLGGGSVGLLAVACGIAVANAYYAQPLLVEIGQSLRLSDLAVSLIPALTQIGVAAGVLLLLPLGDVIPARRLLTVAIIFQAVALAATSLAPSGSVLIAMSLVIGFFGITPYVLPPYATLRTSAQRRGHVTALLVQGIIVGMLLAILLDMGSTAADISNRTVIFSLRPDIRTRLATLYMTSMFAGAGVMAWLTGVFWTFGGWPAVCALGAAPAGLAALTVWVGIGKNSRPLP